ncbi:hypothetical protein BDZ89DRAFT_1038844 [Hymenopellis radicata]|nr:hypothetical protein BDZ89DRAFT_1038844 [Hymenopellis radicata]
MSKPVPKIPIILVEESGYKVINIAGPASLSGKNLRSFDAGFIRQRIQETPASGGYVPDAIYQVDEPNNPRQLAQVITTLVSDNPTPFAGPLDKQFFLNIKLHRIYFVAYPKASPAPTVVKRKPSAEIEIEGYADNPIYIVGDDKGKLDLSAPPSDFQRCLNPPPGRRYLVSDSTMNIPKFLEFCGDSTLGVYTPVPCDLDAASSASMLVSYVDIEKESQFLGTLGKLAVGPYAAAPLSYPPSKDFVMDFDFAEFAVDSLTSTTFEKSLNDYLYVCVADFIPKYDKHLHFGQAGEFLKSTNGNGQAALNKLLKHVERQLDEIGVSRVVMIIRGYDALRNLAEVKSLRTSESPTNPSEFPSPQCITDLFKVNLYHTVFRFLDETGTISRLFLFGTSPAFSAELRPSAYTDLTTMGVLGLAGLTANQVQVYLSVVVGDKPPVGMDVLARTVCQLLPGYTYARNSPPQYPRRLLHQLLPTLRDLRAEKDPAKFRLACGPLIDDVVNLDMFMAAKTLYIRGKHLWQKHFDTLRKRRCIPMSPHADRFRHRYGDFKADQPNGTSYTKDVFVPIRPDPFFAYCVDAGLLTVSFDVQGNGPGVDFVYKFPGHSVRRTFLNDIMNTVDESGLAVRKPFDGSPEWIFNAMDPYLIMSRSTMSNANAPENTFQSIRTNIMHMAEAHNRGDTYDAVMEAEMGAERRADSVVILPDPPETIVIEDKSIKILDFLEGTVGTKLERYPDTHTVIESKLTAEHWRQAKVVSTHLRGLDPRVFTEAELPADDDIPKEPKVPLRTLDNLPDKLEDFFFMGWVDNVYGRHSIFKLWSSAERQGRKYEYDLKCGKVKDDRFTCHKCTGDKKNYITVIVVIVVGGLRVLARRSKLTTHVESNYYLVPTGKNPQCIFILVLICFPVSIVIHRLNAHLATGHSEPPETEFERVAKRFVMPLKTLSNVLPTISVTNGSSPS